jgi:hypothetical protein
MMRVEFGDEVGVLEGTDLAVSYPISLEVDRPDGLRVTATVHVVDGRLVCRKLELSTEQGRIDRNLLHGLGLSTLIRQAANAGVGRLGLPTSDEDSRFDVGLVRSDLQRHIQGLPLVGPRRLTDEFLAEVAATYRKAIKDRETTWVAVARLQKSWFHLPGAAAESTARRWIGTARKRGFLKQTAQGRKGG